MKFQYSGKQPVHVRSLLFAVLTTADNVAVGRPARQSSVLYGATPDRAVDGNTNRDFQGGQSCTHTLGDNYPWWAVDLETVSLVISVHIYSRYGKQGRLTLSSLKRFKTIKINFNAEFVIHETDMLRQVRAIYMIYEWGWWTLGRR